MKFQPTTGNPKCRGTVSKEVGGPRTDLCLSTEQARIRTEQPTGRQILPSRIRDGERVSFGMFDTSNAQGTCHIFVEEQVQDKIVHTSIFFQLRRCLANMQRLGVVTIGDTAIHDSHS